MDGNGLTKENARRCGTAAASYARTLGMYTVQQCGTAAARIYEATVQWWHSGSAVEASCIETLMVSDQRGLRTPEKYVDT